MSSLYYRSQADLRPSLGLVVPSWFPDGYDPGEAERVLATTLADTETLFDPRHVLVMADGSPVAWQAAQAVSRRFPCQVRLLEGQPRGKGAAVAAGLEELLANQDLRWLLVRDHDGDHFLNDVPRLVRLALQIASQGEELVLVNGGRSYPARPMGWVRAEYERLVNSVVWKALHYHAAQRAAALDEAWLTTAAVPDLQSGFKCYSRQAARQVVEATSQAGFAMSRWGCEVLATVAVVVAGGSYGEVQRAALDEQPLTTYEGGARRSRIHGDMLLWVARRLVIPGAVLATWFDAALTHGELRSVGDEVPALIELRRYLLAELSVPERALPAPWFC